MKTRNAIQSFGDNLYSLLTGRYREGTTDLNKLWNATLIRIVKKDATYITKKHGYPDLTAQQKKEIRDFFAPYDHVDPVYHRTYTARSGHFSPMYIPEDMYYGKIECFYTDRDAADYLDNKCYYYHLFDGIKQPAPIVLRIGENWLDKNFELITFEKALEIIESEPAAVVKTAVNSEGGFGVTFLENDHKASDFRILVKKTRGDIVVQRPIKQHPVMAALHPQSVNTYRIMSLLSQDGVKILTTCVRIGTGENRTDNLCLGGLFVGVDDNETMTGIGVGMNGKLCEKHPDLGYTFAGTKVASVKKAEELVKKAHGIMAHCRLASWDIAVDEAGDAVLVETNLALGGINNIQVCHGPLFGSFTKEILDEVFFDKNGKRRKRFDEKVLIKRKHMFFDNLYGIFAGSYSMSDTRPTLLTNKALRRIDMKALKHDVRSFPKLSRDEVRQIRDFYRPYRKNVQTLSHRLYTGSGGKFHRDYIPEDMYLCDISRHLSDRDLAYYLENKCYYPRLFKDVRQPQTYCMRINNIWLDRDYTAVSRDILFSDLAKENACVVKAAAHSEGGIGVFILKFENGDDADAKIKAITAAIEKIGENDIMIQQYLEQSEDTARLHPLSLNTFRILSLIIDDEVHILSRTFKAGTGENTVDNGSNGGIYCGITGDCHLTDIAILPDYSAIQVHPDTNIRFSDVFLPGVKKCDELVKKAHPLLSHNRLISWDVALDSQNEAVLIEANLCFGTSDTPQILDGPLFGKYTKTVLDEVYNKRQNK